MPTNTKKELLYALAINNESPEDLEAVFYKPVVHLWEDSYKSKDKVVKCTFDELPEREFNPGYGSVEGEPIYAYTKDWIYFKVCYDGAEWISWIPRNPENVKNSITVYGDG
jgi:hypothetical protein